MAASPKHHYLPRFYLEGFCSDGLVWVFDREKNEFRRQTPNSIAAQKGYYTMPMADGSKSEEIEKILALAEGQAKPIIDKLARKDPISNTDKPVLSAFIALMHLRVPTCEKRISSFYEQAMTKMMKMKITQATEEQLETIIKEVEEKRGKKAPFTATEWKDMVKNNEIIPRATRVPSLVAMGTVVKPLTEWLVKMDWTFAYAPKDTSFALSDNPFIVFPPPGYDMTSPWPFGVLTLGTQKILPLARNVCLVVHDPGSKVQYVQTDKKQVQHLNRAVVSNSERFVIAHDERLLRSLIKKTRLAPR